MAKMASASQLPAHPAALPNHGTTLASHSHRGATLLNASGAFTSLVPPSDPELGRLETHANTIQTSNDFPQDDPWQKKTVLTFDGGGVRGYSSLLVLDELMSRIQTLEEERDDPAGSSAHPLQHRMRERIQPAPTRASTLRPNERNNSPVAEARSQFLPAHYFDYIGGTSTGGFIAIMLGRLLMTVDECRMAYEDLADSIFGHPRHIHMRKFPLVRRPKYNHGDLEKAIKKIVGDNDHSQDCDAIFFQRFPEMCRTIVISWQKESITGTRKPYLFRSYRHPRRWTPDPRYPGRRISDPLERNPDDNVNHRMWKVARATSAAPSYFKAIKMSDNDEKSKFIDGGFGANNPSEEVYRSVRQLSNNQRLAVDELVSIGTGKKNDVGKRGFVLPLSYAKFAIKWATQSEATHERMLDSSQIDGYNYSRFNVEHGLGEIKLDTWKGKRGAQTLELIRTKTRDYLQSEDVQRDIDEVAQRLVQIRRRRAEQSNSDHWERFCHGVEYSCCVSKCPHGERMARLEELRHHLQNTHSREESQIESSLKQCRHYPLFEPNV